MNDFTTEIPEDIKGILERNEGLIVALTKALESAKNSGNGDTGALVEKAAAKRRLISDKDEAKPGTSLAVDLVVDLLATFLAVTDYLASDAKKKYPGLGDLYINYSALKGADDFVRMNVLTAQQVLHSAAEQ